MFETIDVLDSRCFGKLVFWTVGVLEVDQMG
jgi:hypothetical protein